MADVTGDGSGLTKSVHTSDEAHRRLRRRYNFEWRFKAIGMAAIALAAFALIALLSTVLGNAVGAMRETYITIPVQLDMEVIGVAADADRDAIRRGNFHSVPALTEAIENYLEAHNKDPKPFKWTADANRILEKTKSLCKELI